MNSKIANAFPTPIMGFEIDRMFTDDELQCIEEYKKETIYNLANYTTKDLFVLENPRLQGLKELCQQAINNYFIQIFDPINPDKVNLVLTQSWLNYTSKGHHHHQHHHHNSVLSGCLYIKADRNIDKIKFIKDNGTNWFIYNPQTYIKIYTLQNYFQLKRLITKKYCIARTKESKF